MATSEPEPPTCRLTKVTASGTAIYNWVAKLFSICPPSADGDSPGK